MMTSPDGADLSTPARTPTSARERIRSFDGRRLFHAYGPATDTDVLLGLFAEPRPTAPGDAGSEGRCGVGQEGDERSQWDARSKEDAQREAETGRERDDAARRAATQYLYSAILHQGTPWTATVPVTSLLVACFPAANAASREVIADFVAEVAELGDQVSPTELGAWIAATPKKARRAWERLAASGDEGAYEQAFEDEDVANYMYYLTLREILDARESWGRALLAHLAQSDVNVALRIARAVIACGLPDAGTPASPRRPGAPASSRTERSQGANSWGGSEERASRLAGCGAVASYLRERADTGGGTQAQRAFAARQLAGIGFDVTKYLTDDALPVRVAAAFGTQADNAAASAVVLAALHDPARVDAAFDGEPRVFGVRATIALTERLVAALREGFDVPAANLVDVALAAARYQPGLAADWGWGRFIEFVLRGSAVGCPLDAEQRRYLAGLCEIEVWNPTNGTNRSLFAQVGLPYDRDTCRALAAGAPLTSRASR